VAKLKVGAGLTNGAGGVTLNMDGIGAQNVLDQRGNALVPGMFNAGSYVDVLFNGTNWILQTPFSANATVNCGYLQIASATALSFTPYNGNSIQINGIIYRIPVAGIAGLANTNVYVGNVPAQNLVANTTYLVFAFSNAGVVTADFHTGVTHAPSTTTGNEGVEVMTAGASYLDSFTLIGIIRTNASSQFVDTQGTRFVRSWFNRRRADVMGADINGNTTGYTVTFSGMAVPAAWVNFAGEAIDISATGFNSNDTASTNNYHAVMIDGSAQGQFSYNASAGSFIYNAYSAVYRTTALAEGYHSADVGAFVAAGTNHIWGRISGIIG